MFKKDRIPRDTKLSLLKMLVAADELNLLKDKDINHLFNVLGQAVEDRDFADYKEIEN